MLSQHMLRCMPRLRIQHLSRQLCATPIPFRLPTPYAVLPGQAGGARQCCLPAPHVPAGGAGAGIPGGQPRGCPAAHAVGPRHGGLPRAAWRPLAWQQLEEGGADVAPSVRPLLAATCMQATRAMAPQFAFMPVNLRSCCLPRPGVLPGVRLGTHCELPRVPHLSRLVSHAQPFPPPPPPFFSFPFPSAFVVFSPPPPTPGTS
jgi:hypothetical protein